MSISMDARGPTRPDGEKSQQLGRRDSVRAWLASAVAFAVALAAAIWGPRPGDSVIWLVSQLTVIVAFGLGGSVAAVWFSVKALRLGRYWAAASLIVASFLALQSLLRVLGTLGRFYGWG
jgi:hypothetical protein